MAASLVVNSLRALHPDQLFGRSPGSRWVKADRFAVDSPRDRRQAHSFRMLSAKPSSKITLKLSSAVSATAPSSRSISARVTSSTGTRRQVDVAKRVESEADAGQLEVALQQPSVDAHMVLIGPPGNKGPEVQPVPHLPRERIP